MVEIIVSTTQRSRDYLSDTVRRIDQTGGLSYKRTIYCDGPFSGTQPAGWGLVQTKERAGSRVALLNALRGVTNDVLLLEDDLALCANAVTAMVSYPIPNDAAFVSFFDERTPPGARGLQIRSLDEGSFWGTLAIKLPARFIPYLYARSFATNGLCHGRDYALQYFAKRSPWPRYGLVFPNLVQHVGDESSVNSSRAAQMHAAGLKRQSQNYPGDTYDALCGTIK